MWEKPCKNAAFECRMPPETPYSSLVVYLPLQLYQQIPKELMLFVKNFAYLSSVMQELDPEMDLLTEFLEVASGFFGRNGVRVATEIGFSLGAEDVTDMTFRRVAGLRENVSTLTWKELGERRNSLLERMDRRSIKKIID